MAWTAHGIRWQSVTAPEPEDAPLARQVLTDVQFQTWALAERGISHRAIALWRGVSKATVTDCLAEVDRKLEKAREEARAADPS